MATVVVDARERALHPCLPSASVRQLAAGDVLIEDADGQALVVIERKTLADLAASIKDGRYREQRVRLTETYGSQRVMYVIEAPSFRMDDAAPVSGVNASSVQGCVVSLLSGGIRVVRTSDVRDTAALITRLAERLGRTTERVHYSEAACAAAQVRKRDNVDARQCFLQQLCQIPGVSIKIASNIQRRFGTLAGLFKELMPSSPAERVAELGSLPLVGPKTAARIAGYVFDEGDVERLPDPAVREVLVAELGHAELQKHVEVAATRQRFVPGKPKPWVKKDRAAAPSAAVCAFVDDPDWDT